MLTRGRRRWKPSRERFSKYGFRAAFVYTLYMELYFSQYYGVEPQIMRDYGAFDISVVSDLPLFVDPFLLFNSEKDEYRQLHDSIIDYLVFLREKASPDLESGLVANWYRFKEVKQNWFGFTLFGNGGHGLSRKFGSALHDSLGSILVNFGNEDITRGKHLEKLCLIRPGVGRDGISDFTTNLIKGYLCEYTQAFAREHLSADQCANFRVSRARFNYTTESWETGTYYLPRLRDDYVLLTPEDILTRDEPWISHGDMLKQFTHLPDALPNQQLRDSVNNYFRQQLGKRPTRKELDEAAQKTIQEFPELIDYYIKTREDDGDRAQAVSNEKVEDTREVLVEQLKKAIRHIEATTDFYDRPWTSFDEALDRALAFKHYVENCDGYRVINRAGRPFSREDEVQLFFGLIWCKSEFDVNREPNNGRGPVDFKVSYGSGDSSLIEFKLASNTSLKRNLQNQLPIYQAANRTNFAVKVIICYTQQDEQRVAKILGELKLTNEKTLVVIDSRNDNKPSASKA